MQGFFAAMKIAGAAIENKGLIVTRLFSCTVASRKLMESSLRMTGLSVAVGSMTLWIDRREPADSN
jgi:hypothetical protein